MIHEYSVARADDPSWTNNVKKSANVVMWLLWYWEEVLSLILIAAAALAADNYHSCS
jgi:hypothetical protein